jgi:hypothetical protein
MSSSNAPSNAHVIAVCRILTPCAFQMQNHDVGSLPAWKQDRTPSTSSSGADMAWARVVGTSHNDTDDWIMQRHHLLG